MADLENEEERAVGAPDLHLVRRLLQYLRPYSWHALALLALMALATPLTLAGPPLTRAAVDLFLAPDPSKPPSGFAHLLKACADAVGLGGTPYQGLLFLTGVLLLANGLAFATQYAQWLVMETIGQSFTYDLRERVFAHLQRLPIHFYDRTPVGRLMTRLTSDVDALNEMFTSGLIEVIGDVAILSYIVLWMFRVDWRLSLVSFAILPLLALLTAWVRTGIRGEFRVVRSEVARLNTFVQERLSGMATVQLFNRQAGELASFVGINDALRRAYKRTILYNAAFQPGMEILKASGIGLILWYGSGQRLRDVTSLGTLIAFIQLVQTFHEVSSELTQKYNVLQAAIAASERIFSLLDEPVAATPALPARRNAGGASGRIEFRNVWFAYEGESWVLKDVSFVVEPGETVAFVGHTGAGKTTITNLLLRFYDVQRGQILLDDVDIRERDPVDLRANFSIVLQDVFLCSADVISNIRLGNDSITEPMAVAAAREVHADRFIKQLPKGYQSELFEGGAGLSSGQKQLLGFARALAFDRPILILDEATSAIDTETELLIRDALGRLLAGRTALLIAHRLSTIQRVDKIMVLHKGQICEVGDHRSLLARRGLYWRLYRLQSHRHLTPTISTPLSAD